MHLLFLAGSNVSNAPAVPCRSAIANLAAVKNLGACGRVDGNSGESPPYEFWNKVWSCHSVTVTLLLIPCPAALPKHL